jgi:hypothetical protein
VAVLAMDVRALGEGKVHDNHCASNGILLGRPLLAQQTWDVLCAVRCLGQRADVDADRTALYGRGSVGLIATLAGALSETPLAVASEGAIGSFTSAISDPLPQPLWVYAPSILKVADVSQLVALAAPAPVLWARPVGIRRKQLPEGELKVLAQPAVRSYAAAGVPSAFTISRSAPSPERVASFLTESLRR